MSPPIRAKLYAASMDQTQDCTVFSLFVLSLSSLMFDLMLAMMPSYICDVGF